MNELLCAGNEVIAAKNSQTVFLVNPLAHGVSAGTLKFPGQQSIKISSP
jgi:hypothetical protein